ncbi:two component transcriptional regulator, LuxR family [Brevibacterium iodinum ATCC 49514]|uniref:Two component transcriptional regulator, LuxR family n=1 Tax=Brevibacterium iodinum ATCC 49514 TaxID=1255616 RepID=A0A2H1J8F6_9MICO|nr:response regulator transcription factor [Brevibacterium iodinum]SMX83766.1 two component transcriptional regulator, LuxR family [Brevibacterium iodinum ATCC 49514]SUW11155.1 Nitrogen regulation protein C [Brevibacterium iodinum]
MSDRDETRAGPLCVVLVDDQALVRAGFAMVIDSQPDLTVVGQAGDGVAGLDIVTRDEPDVVLMDIRMPRVDGIEATQRILALADAGTIRAPKIIVLTTFDDDEYALRALRAGAAGFLLKDTLPEVLLDSIRTVVDGGAVIAPTTTKRLLDTRLLPHPGEEGSSHPGEISAGEAPATSGAGADFEASASAEVGGSRLSEVEARRLESLTPREREVLVLIATGLSNTEIGERLFLAQPTVKTHVGRILMKLEARDRVQAVVLAYEAGLVGHGR